MNSLRSRWTLPALVLLLLLIILISLNLGRYPITPGEVLKLILAAVHPAEGNVDAQQQAIFYNVRLPRIILACLVGCCLSAAGAAYQGIFQNPMAAPDVLGASAGAAFGAALAILLGGGKREITFSAFLFSILCVLLVLAISRRTKGRQVLGLILSGIMVGSLFSACTSFIKLVADPNEQLPAITYWLMGSLAGTKKEEVLFIVIPMVLGLVPLLLLRWRVNVLTLGDAEARTMGVNAGAVRLAVIVCATLITASSVAVSGMIGWVGLVIPHLTRFLVGNNYQRLLPASMLAGAVFLLIVDNFSRNLWTSEVPIGILTAIIGAPFFISLILKAGDAA
ncbi:iron ABC transporter permease [Paenibacillus macerans]|uniref:FecCD family ABC transporter permease n=1 Tax=Paenibacillus macerans TaxID=44252 RepID=UPI00203E9469|nr:iron ABC transporter permease [Paenibacillus macerans]MCM3703105.1 iron ABC transporter permease [Paenibacillus macerans]